MKSESFFMWIKDIRDYILYEDKDILVCHKPAGMQLRMRGLAVWMVESLEELYCSEGAG